MFRSNHLNNVCVASTFTLLSALATVSISGVPLLQFNVRSGNSVVNVQQDVAHFHKAAAAHLASIPECTVASSAADQELVVTFCERRCPLLFPATELITHFVFHQSCLYFCFYFSDYSMKTKSWHHWICWVKLLRLYRTYGDHMYFIWFSIEETSERSPIIQALFLIFFGNFEELLSTAIYLMQQ